MKKQYYAMTIFLAILGFSLIIPMSDIQSADQTISQYIKTNSSIGSGIGDNIEDFVDQISNLHGLPDIGTHNIFSDLQDYGINYNQMTEGNTDSSAYDLEDYVDQQSNLHDPADIGTHSNFTEMQDQDGNYNTLTESAHSVAFDIETVESLEESSYNTAANTWQEKCSITIAPASGTRYYVVIASATIKASSASYRSLGRVIVDDTTTKYQVELQPKYVTDYTTLFCCFYVELTYPATQQVDIEYATTNTGNTVSIRDARILAIGLNSAIEAYDEDLSRISDTDTTYTTLSSVTVTPSGTENYIIIASFVYDGSSTTSSTYARLYDGASALQEDMQEPVNAAGRYPFATIQYVSISSSTTYSIEARSESFGNNNGAAYGHIVVMDSSVFNQVAFNSAASQTTPSAVNSWQTLVSNSYTAVSDNYLIIGSAQYRSASTRESASTRLYYNGGTTGNDAIQEDKDVTDWHSSASFVYLSQSSGSKEDRIQMWDEGTGLGADFRQAWLFAIQVAPPSTPAKLDLEIGWTSVPYTEDNEYLCIYGGVQGAEALRVDVWDGSQWQNIIADVAEGWNNVSVSSYLTGSSFEIRFTDTSDDWTTQDSWQIDSVLLYVWTPSNPNYELDLEVGWTNVDYDETNEELCIFPITGVGWPSEDIKVDIWNGAWVNVIADLVPDQWNNVSISSYLTSSTFEIRFLGGTETGDTTQDTWEIDAVLIHAWTPSYAPVIEQIPTLDNPTDSDNMYAKYQEYRITVYVSDQNGFADIDYLEIGLWDNTRATEFCRFRYDEDTDAFTKEYDAGTYVSLNTGSSSATKSGSDIDATFYFTIDWDFPDSVDLDAKCYVVDAQAESAETWYEVDWDVETRLDYSISPSINDGSGTPNRGNIDGAFSLTGTIIYYNSADVFSSSDSVDVYIVASEYGTNVGPWGDLTLTSGAFDVTCYADDLVGQDTYTIKIVEEGAGYTGEDLYFDSSYTVTYIADQLTISITDPIDQRINVNANASGIVVTGTYDYDSAPFEGTLTLNDTVFVSATVGKRGYTVSFASGGSHGVTFIGSNDVTYCIWDSLTISITDPSDQRININANASGIVVTAVYDYDLTLFDGTLSLNNTQFVYATAQIQWYTVVSVSGGIHGITMISTNDATWCIWDSLTITISGPPDQRININMNASGIIVTAVYDYDASTFDGLLILNNTQFTYPTAQIQYYTVLSVSGGLHGITAISSNDITYYIWDSLTVTITGPSDQRIDINANASGIVVFAVYDYDSSIFDGVLTLNNTQFVYSVAQIQWYTVQSASGGAHGITAISVNDVTYCIWDSLTISISGPLDQRININANATGIIVTAIYDFDGSIFDGLITLNNTLFTYATAQIQWYAAQSASGGIHGITAISSNDLTYCIWDSLTISISGPFDQRINIDTNASGIVVAAIYDYDSTLFDGIITLNNTQFVYGTAQIQWYTAESVSGGTFGITAIATNDVTYCIWDSITIAITDPFDQRVNVNSNASGIFVNAFYDYDGSIFDGILNLNNTQFSYPSAQIQWYSVNSVSGSTYGITVISTNDVTYCIWDSLTVTIIDPLDQRININSNASGIVIAAVYDYDGAKFDGVLTLNNTQFSYGTAQIQYYTVQSASGGIYGISTISANDVTYCIWDSLTISITDPLDQRININTNASGIILSAIYDYDGSVFDGTLLLNNTQFTYNTAQIQWYTAESASGGSFGITAISTNDVIYCIWDSLTIVISNPSDQRININENASGIIVSARYDYDGSIFDGTLTLNNTVFVYATAQKQGYTVELVSGGIHGITTISANDVTYCIWDSLSIVITDPFDQRININENATGIFVTAIYDYDGSVFDGILGLNNTQFVYAIAQRQAYTVNSVSGGIYGITAFSTNDVTYCIWDSLTVSITDPLDQRININTNASGIVVTAIYDYDGSAFDGILTLNNTQFSYGAAQIQYYVVQSAFGGSFGISALSANDVTYCIWDSLTISITNPSDQRIDVNENATGIIVNAVYDYDGVTFDGSLILNNTQFVYATAQIQWYTVTSVSGGIHGITAISTNDITYFIWDSLTIIITGPVDQRIGINTNASGIIVSAIYDYDGSAFDGTLHLNNTQFIYDTTQVQWYSVESANGGSHGITVISTNDVTYCIWDQLVVTIEVDDSTPFNGVQANFTMTVIFDYDDSLCTSYQIVIQRNGTWWISLTEANKSLFVDLSFNMTYTYNVRLVTSESLYNILSFSTNSVQVVWSAAPNNPPMNDAAPNLINADDSSYMYARYRYYIITSNVSDPDGYTDIEYVELTLYDDSRMTAVWTVRYTVASGTFSVQHGGAYIILSVLSSSTMAGNQLNITWHLMIDWDHPVLTSTDVRQSVFDGANSVADFYESDWNIETRLEIIELTIDDGFGTGNRGPLDGSFIVSGTVIYLGSIDNYPSSAEIDVWVFISEYGTTIGPWSDLVLVSGQFNITAYADDQVGLDTITLKVVAEGAGSDGFDLLSTTTESSYIADRIIVQAYTSSDDRANIGDLVTIDVTLVYEYDTSLVTDGTVTVNGFTPIHQGSGIWKLTDSESSVAMNIYDAVAYSGGIHGLTQVNQNSKSLEIIWDQIVVQMTVADDTRVNVGDSAEIRVTLWLAYDSTPLGISDVVILNGVPMNWDAVNSWFDLSVIQSSVGIWKYFVNSTTESTYGITSFVLNGNDVDVIWDRVQVQSYSVSDSRTNLNDSVHIDVTIFYDYDDSPVIDGTVTINGISATHQGSGVWRISDTESIVVMNTYNLVVCSGNTYAITLVDQNSESVEVIWDRLVIMIGVDDSSMVNGHQANFTLTVTYDFDDSICTSYQIVIFRDNAWWYSFIAGNLSLFVDSGIDIVYAYNASLVTSESIHGINAFITNTLVVSWSEAPNENPTNDSSPSLLNADDVDYLYARYRYYVIVTAATDPDGCADIVYVELSLYSDDGLTLYWTIRYTQATNTFSIESGGSTLSIGLMSSAIGVGTTLTITWYIKIDWSHADVSNADVELFVTDGDASDSDLYEVDWDVETRLDYSTSPILSDHRGDVDTTDLIGSASVVYYKSTLSPLANETDIWILHDESGSWTGDLLAGSYSIMGIGSSSSVRLNTYTFKIVAQGVGSDGSDLYYSTSPTDTFITDRIEIFEAGTVDSRININTYCEVWWRARYEYDGAVIQSLLTIELNGSKLLLWKSDSLYWSWQETWTTPQSHGFDISLVSELNYGISSWTVSTIVQQVIWDALIITMTDPVDQRININENATGIVVSAVYAFDGAPFNGIFTLNNSVFQYSMPQRQGYTVLTVSSDTHGITAIQTNDVTYCIWDRVLVVSVSADELYHDPNDDVRISVVLHYEYDDSPVLAGTFAIAGHSLAHVGSGVWQAQVTMSTYQVIDFDDLSVCDGTLHGIGQYSMNSNSVTVYWDRIEFYAVSVLDTRINVDDSIEIRWSARLENAGISISSGIVALMTGDVSLVFAAGMYSASVSRATVGSMTFAILSASLGEIGQFTQTASDVTIIWDRVRLTSILATSLSQDAGIGTEIHVTLIYEYDSSPVTDGAVNLGNGGVLTSMSYDSTEGYWKASIVKNIAGNYSFTVASVSDNIHGISSLNTNGLSIVIEWVAVPGFVFDTMTLMIVGGGVAIGILGVALIASRRRGGGAAVGLVAIEPTPFEAPQVAEESEFMESAFEEPDIEPMIEEPQLEESTASELEPPSASLETEGTSEPEISVEPTSIEPEEIGPEEPIEELAETELEPLEEIEATSEEIIDKAIETEIAVDEGLMVTESGVELEIEDLTPMEETASEPPQVESDSIESDVLAEPEIEESIDVVKAEDQLEDLSVESLTKEQILDRLPPEVRDAIPAEDMERMSLKEAQALVESYTPQESTSMPISSSAISEASDASLIAEELSELDKSTLIELLPPDIKATLSPGELKRLSKKELISLLESFMEPE